MSDISSQLIKDSYNYVLQSDLSTGIVYRIGGGIPVNPKFLSGLTINSNFNYSNGTEQPGFVLITDASGNATWGPVSGSSSGDYVPYTGATKDVNLGTHSLRANNGFLGSWSGSSIGETKIGYDYQGAKQMFFIDKDITNTYQYSGQSIDFICNFVEGWSTTTLGYDINDGTYFGSAINNTIGAAGFNTQMGNNNVSQVKTFAGEVAITNLNDGNGTLMESSIKLWKDYTQLLITNNDTSEDNSIEMYTDRTYTKKYITTDEGYVGDYANLNTLTSTTISATTYFNLPVSGVTGGTGISAGTTNGLVTIVNTAPDQIVTITGGTNIGINGTYPNFGINFTGSTGVSGNFLPLSGGTVSGATIFTGGLTADTISATTYQNLPVTSLSGLSDVSITSVSGGEVLVYSGSSWVNKTLNEINGHYSIKITTPSSDVTGTVSETQVLKVEIPANSLSLNEIISIPLLIMSKTGTAGTCEIRVKISTSSTMPSGNTDAIARYSSGANNLFAKMQRDFIIDNGTIKVYPLSSNLIDNTTSTVSILTKSFNPTVTNYLYVSLQQSAIGDSSLLQGFYLTNQQ